MTQATKSSEPFVFDGNKFIDDRGSISFVNAVDPSRLAFRRMYIVHHDKQHMIRAWHAHNREDKYVFVTSGSFLVGAASMTTREVKKFVLSCEQPKVLWIPPGYANGFMNLTSTGDIMFFSTSTLDESKNDDIRLPWNEWNIWEDNFR